MAFSGFLVEDGSGVTGASSYTSVAQAIIYATALQYVEFLALDTAGQENALLQASFYMTSQYRMKWKGRRVLITQGLDWPRVGVVLEDFGGSQGRNGYGSYGLFQVSYTIVPDEVQNACAVLAQLWAQNGDLNPPLAQNVLKEEVGPIMVQYDPNSPQYTRYRQVDNLLSPYQLADGGQMTAGLIRT